MNDRVFSTTKRNQVVKKYLKSKLKKTNLKGIKKQVKGIVHIAQNNNANVELILLNILNNESC